MSAHLDSLKGFIALVQDDLLELDGAATLQGLLAELQSSYSYTVAETKQNTALDKKIARLASGESTLEKVKPKIIQGLERLHQAIYEKSSQDDEKIIINLDDEQNDPEPVEINNDSESTSDEVVAIEGFYEACDLMVDVPLEFLDKFAVLQNDNLEEFETQVLSYEEGSEEATDYIKRILHSWKGDFGVLGLNEYAQLIHTVEESFLGNMFLADNLFRLKDFLQESFHYFLDHKIPEILDDSILHLFEASHEEQAVSVVEHTIPQDIIAEMQTINLLKDDLSLVEDFIIESKDHLQKTEKDVLLLEKSPDDLDLINQLFRAAHTIKGVAGFLNLKIIGGYSHHLENLLAGMRKEELTVDQDIISVLLSSFDVLKQLILSLEAALNGDEFPLPSDYLNSWNVLAETQGQKVVKSSIVQEAVKDVVEDVIHEKMEEPKPQQAVLEEVSFIEPKEEPQVEVQTPAVSSKLINSIKKKEIKVVKDDSIRVSTGRLDQLIDIIGELVISQSMLEAESLSSGIENLELEKKFGNSALLIRQIQEISMSLRMIPVQGTFQKMARIVRDLSKKIGKPIEFKTEGEETELDKSVVENIADPLMHMVRNSIDHGIESVAQRLESGKPEKASITLRSYNKGGNIYIDIEDDGQGLNRDVILSKAIKNGLCNADDTLSDQEIFRFIFNPGFSTAEKVTDLSGRGVGMDVVKKNIESLRGSIGIDSVPGKGTIFSIRLPLTLAIIDGMLVKVGDIQYVFPTLSMVENVKISDEEIVNTYDDSVMVKIRDELIPVCILGDVFGFTHKCEKLSDGILLIVEDMVGSKLGILVDEIIGQHQTVIKSMGEWVGEVKGIAGGAIMNTGQVSLIVDIAGLSSLVKISKSKPVATGEEL